MDKWIQIWESLTWVDLAALGTFWLSWFGYTLFAERGSQAAKGLVGVTHEYRLQWAMESPRREIPIADAALVGNLMTSVSFYASTTIYIIAGLLALIGTIDRFLVFTADLPFFHQGTRQLLEIKILLLIIIFITAYFKFTWSLRQFNFLCILIGGVPYEKNISDETHRKKIAERMAKISSYSGNDFNRGIRAYYFGISALAWFIDPILFIAATICITFIIYRRDFHSPAIKVLRDEYPPSA